MVASYKELKIWEKGKEIAKLSYSVTSRFPKEEMYGLTSQIRRCAVSIPSNIAEGYARHSDREFARFLSISGGSLAELETQIILSYELGFVDKKSAESIFVEIENLKGMLWIFRKKVKDRIENAA